MNKIQKITEATILLFKLVVTVKNSNLVFFTVTTSLKLVPLSFDSQPFESRRRWFYDNLDREGSNREIIHSPPDDNDVLVINRGKTRPGLLL